MSTWHETGRSCRVPNSRMSFKMHPGHATERCCRRDNEQGPFTFAAEPEHAMLANSGTVFLLHPPLPLLGVSIEMERGCQHFDSIRIG